MPTMAKTRAVIYVRQSVSREESISLELQENACRQYAAQRGYDVVGEPLRDPGVSGLQYEKRPGIRRAIEAVESKSAQVVIVYRWSRLSRRQIHQAVILDRVERARGRVESATESVDSAKASGRFSRNVMLAAAEFESQQKSEQWKEAQSRRRERGLPAGGAPPFGYARSAERGGPFIIDTQRGPVLKQMYDDYLKGHGYQAIARSLNDRGIRSQRGNEMSIITVQRAMDSGFGAGLLRLDVNVRDQDGKRIDQPVRWERGAHQPIIDERTWQAYQRERDKRRVVHPKSRQPKWHLGGGLAVCGLCGANLIVNSYSSAKSQAICSAYKSKRTCSGVWINRVPLETRVALWLGGHVDAWADAQDDVQGADEERRALAMDLKAAEDAEARVAQGLATAARLVASGAMLERDYLEARDTAESERAHATAAVADVQARLDTLSPDADVYERIQRGVAGQTTEEWSVILRRVIRSVSVSPKTVTITPWRGKAAVIPRSQL